MASKQLQTIVDMLRTRAAEIGGRQRSVAEMREGYETMSGLFGLAEDIQCETTRAGGVQAEWISAPGATAEHCLLYLHGGGYVIGSINTHRDLVSRLSRASGARGLALDYRLAPENPFPAAVEDATAAYRWLLASGFAPEKISIGGDSAGGGLTIATLLALRDAGDPLPAAAACLSPWVDLEAASESMASKADEDPMVQRGGLLEMASAYLAGADPRTPTASPVHASLEGLPPLLIHVGSAETLLDDSIRLARNAERDNVEVELEVWDEMIHVFQAFAPMLPEGQESIEKIGKFVSEALAS